MFSQDIDRPKWNSSELADICARAEQGDAEAQLCWGTHLFDATEDDSCLKWFKSAAKQKLPEAVYAWGIMHFQGMRMQKDEKYGARLIEQAASGGHAAAQLYIGYCYRNGEGVKRNYAKACKWFEMAAEQGNLTALFELAKCYMRGWGVARDFAQANRILKDAADKGFLDAKHELAVSYLKGTGVEQDTAEGMRLMTEAAEGQCLEAMYDMAYLYAFGGLGVSNDLKLSKKWMRRAMETDPFFEDDEELVESFLEMLDLVQLTGEKPKRELLQALKSISSSRLIGK